MNKAKQKELDKKVTELREKFWKDINTLLHDIPSSDYVVMLENLVDEFDDEAQARIDAANAD